MHTPFPKVFKENLPNNATTPRVTIWSLSAAFYFDSNAYSKKQIRTLREMRKSSDLFVLVTHRRVELRTP